MFANVLSRAIVRSLIVLSLSVVGAAPAMSASLSDPDAIVTVMQFTAKDASMRGELKKRMEKVAAYLKGKPGLIEHALMENANSSSVPHYVGVARWKSVKDWENLWLSNDFQGLVKNLSEVGTVNPGMFRAAK